MFEITDDMAKNGIHCPFCGKFYRPNGVGPSDLPELTTALDSLPSSHVLRYGANFHDIAYHCGSFWGTRKQADDLMFEKNKAYIKSLNLGWIKSAFYNMMNYRNWLAVRMFGGKFFNHKGCRQ